MVVIGKGKKSKHKMQNEYDDCYGQDINVDRYAADGRQ